MLFHSDLTRFCRRLDCSSCWLGTMGREKGQGCEVAAGVANSLPMVDAAEIITTLLRMQGLRKVSGLPC